MFNKTTVNHQAYLPVIKLVGITTFRSLTMKKGVNGVLVIRLKYRSELSPPQRSESLYKGVSARFPFLLVSLSVMKPLSYLSVAKPGVNEDPPKKPRTRISPHPFLLSPPESAQESETYYKRTAKFLNPEKQAFGC